MLPILADNSEKLLLLLETQLTHKGVKKRFKKITKKMVLDFHLTIPIIIALSILKNCEAKLSSQKKLKILIHQLNSHDCIDHLRWVALVPALLGNPNLQLEVVGINSDEIKDNVSNASALIDFLIEKEDLKSRFKSSLYQGDIDDLNDIGTYDLIINNNASPVHLFGLLDSEVMNEIINNNIPYVLVDFTQGVLLNNYNLFRSKGFASNDNLIENKFTTKFNTKLNAIEYGHARYLISINEKTSHNLDLTKNVFVNYVSALKVRLDHGDQLHINQVAKPLINDEIQLFPNVVLNTKTHSIKVNYFGDTYNVNVAKNLTIPPIDLNTLDSDADKFHWALNVYQGVLFEIISRKEKSA
ncbi:MAG: hypothetical protein ACI92O_000485 [Colwellia sp.]|jgi:hypothetical protein